jgi:phosphatidate cytidylyltransferase
MAGRRGSRGARGEAGTTVRRRAPAPREPRPAGGGRGSDLLARVLWAIPAIVFAIFLVVQGGVVFAVGVLALGIVCLHELYAMFERFHPIRLGGFLAVAGIVAAALYGAPIQILLAFAAGFLVIFLLTLASPVRSGATMAIAITLLGVLWIGLPLAYAVLLRDLPHGDGIVVDVLVGTFIGDTAAYLGGQAFGQRPLAPGISPNKTVEGLAIGIVIGAVAVWFAGLYQDWLSGWDALLLGVCVAAVAPLGDLFESLIKRDASTKDTGKLFGAHGGALDRLDAVLFAIPVGFYVWLAML